MTDQLTFEDISARKHQGNPESVAAQKGRKGKAAAQRARVLAAIAQSGSVGLSVDELAERWGVGANVVSGRFSELKKAGKITKAGTRPTRTGNKAGVYITNHS